MNAVRVHYNSPEPAKMGAKAYAMGKDVHLGASQEKHLPHELWHVAQQMSGRVKPQHIKHGSEYNADPSLEKEADSMGQKALSIPIHRPCQSIAGPNPERVEK